MADARAPGVRAPSLADALIPLATLAGLIAASLGWYSAASAIICAIVALSIGSSWTTAATLGVGLVGIATMIGVPRRSRREQ